MTLRKITRVVIYLRVSTDKQADEGFGMDVQRERCHTYATLYGLVVVAVLEDPGASAKTLDRPGLQKALDMLRRDEADAILVAKLDRLTRSVAHLCSMVDTYFAGNRWSLLSVAEQFDTRSAGGRLVLNVLTSVSQWEREVIGERTSAAMRVMRASGEYTGGRAPYGFRLGADGRLESDEQETYILQIVQEMHAGGETLHGICRALARRGACARSGRPFGAGQIARMIRSVERRAPNVAEPREISAA